MAALPPGAIPVGSARPDSMSQDSLLARVPPDYQGDDVRAGAVNVGTTTPENKIAFDRMMREMVPPIAAATVTGLMPASRLVPPQALGAMKNFVIPGLIRTGAAWGAGAGSELAAQSVSREPLDFEAAAREGTNQSLFQAGGEILPPAALTAGKNTYRGLYRRTAKQAEQTRAVFERVKGQPVELDEAVAADLARKERIPAGRFGGRGESGAMRHRSLKAAAVKPLDDALVAADMAGFNVKPQKLGTVIDDVVAESAGTVGGTERVLEVKQAWKDLLGTDDFVKLDKKTGRVLYYRNLNARKLDGLVRKWQNQADVIYKRQRAGHALSGRESTQMELAYRLAYRGREILREIPFKSSTPGKTIGDLIGDANDRLSMLHQLDEPVAQVEAAVAGGTGAPRVPLGAHIGASGAGAASGLLLGGPPGAAVGTLAGEGSVLLANRLRDPRLSTRLALTAERPMAQELMRQSPRALSMLKFLLDPPMQAQPAEQTATVPRIVW